MDDIKITTQKEQFLTPDVVILINKHMLKILVGTLSLFALLGSLGITSFLSNAETRVVNDVKSDLKDQTQAFRNRLSERSIEAGIEISEAKKNARKATDAAKSLLEAAKGAEVDIARAKDFANSASKSAEGIAKVLLEDPKFRNDIAEALSNQFKSEWITPKLENQWIPYSSAYSPPGYYKDSTGVIWLRGMVKSGALQKAIFTLPVEYRPLYRILHVGTTSPNVSARIDITKDGEVLPWQAAQAWVSLDGISFSNQ